jgi:hypothetical protein
MSFRITGLAPQAFEPLFALGDEALAARGIERRVVDAFPGFPDRIGLDDIPIGETALLLNWTHQPANTPYRASHAIFVRERATPEFDETGVVPPALRRRVLSLRAFDGSHRMVHADLASGAEIEAKIAALFADPRVAYLHAHYAKPGCYAARIDRVGAG